MKALTKKQREETSAQVRVFDARHGHLPVIFGAVYLYSDGARRSTVDGSLMEPPEDEALRKQLVSHYRGIRKNIKRLSKTWPMRKKVNEWLRAFRPQS